MGIAETIAAMIQQESGGDPNLRNPRTGAMGLMQVMPDTARQPGFGVQPLANPWDAGENKRFGTDYFNAMLKRYNGDNDAALAAYNWGPANADRWVASGKTSPLPAETRNYISSVNAMAARGGSPNVQGRAPAAAQAAPDPFAGFWAGSPQRTQANGGQPMVDTEEDPWDASFHVWDRRTKFDQPPDEPGVRKTPLSIGSRGYGGNLVPPRMSDMANSMVPGIFGGGDQPGYFGRLFSDPTFLQGAAVLSGGLQGQDFGTALQRGTQAATSAADMATRRQKAAAWARLWGPDGQANMNAPLLKGVPPEILPVVQAMGPEEGVDALVKLVFKRLAPHQLTSVAPGASLYDEQAGKVAYTAPPKTDAPAGYRATPEGNLEAIPGGPATHLGGDQAGRLALMRQARGDLEQAKQIFGGNMSVSGRVAKVFGMGETGAAERTVATAVEATLRALSGAAAPQTEVDRYNAIFAPTIYDGPTTRMDKLRRLEQFINDAEQTITQGRGPAMQPGQQPPPRRGPTRPDDPLGILD